jgi:hypothetical protein
VQTQPFTTQEAFTNAYTAAPHAELKMRVHA